MDTRTRTTQPRITIGAVAAALVGAVIALVLVVLVVTSTLGLGVENVGRGGVLPPPSVVGIATGR